MITKKSVSLNTFTHSVLLKRYVTTGSSQVSLLVFSQYSSLLVSTASRREVKSHSLKTRTTTLSMIKSVLLSKEVSTKMTTSNNQTTCKITTHTTNSMEAMIITTKITTRMMTVMTTTMEVITTTHINHDDY